MGCLLGCAMTLARGSDGPTERGLRDSVVVLERAINALADPSSDYRTTLQNVLPALPAGSQDFLKTDITAFLSRAPDPGADFQCSAEFVRYKARKELLRLKDMLLDSSPQPAEPQFCYAVPFAIDPALPTRRIEIYGYDFDREPMQVLLMNSYGFTDVTFAVVTQSHYHMTLELEKHGLEVSPENRVLALTLHHIIQHAIPVIQPDTRLCESRIEDIPADKVIAYDPPSIVRGRSFTVAGASVVANAALDYDSNVVDATMCVTATAPGEDPNAVSGCAGEFVYTSESGRLIEWVSGDLQSRIAYTSGSGEKDVRKGAGRGPVDRWTFTAGSPTSPAGAEPGLAVRLRKLQVVSTQVGGGCVSPIAYLEARRMRALSAGVVRRLDTELTKVDRAILKLRPRFAGTGG